MYPCVLKCKYITKKIIVYDQSNKLTLLSTAMHSNNSQQDVKSNERTEPYIASNPKFADPVLCELLFSKSESEKHYIETDAGLCSYLGVASTQWSTRNSSRQNILRNVTSPTMSRSSYIIVLSSLNLCIEPLIL